MADKLGETYDAHISGIQSYGIYCEIDVFFFSWILTLVLFLILLEYS